MTEDILTSLGAQPSVSEERGLALLNDTDLVIFSPGISTGGFAEIRMAKSNPSRHIISTTIDDKGLSFAQEVIETSGVKNQIDTKLEDLRDMNYPEDYFDFIYARLVLHYLSAQDLDAVLHRMYLSLKKNGRIFVVVRSIKNPNTNDPEYTYDPVTKLSRDVHRRADGSIEATSVRYFHSPESISEHLESAGFHIVAIEEYQERLYKDFMRKEISPNIDHLIEVVATK